MQIFHRFGINTREREGLRDELKEAGIRHEYDQTIIGNSIYLDMAEGDPKWGKLMDLANRYDFRSCHVWTKFTQKELDSAYFLEAGSDWEAGYPMPDEDSGYREATYDLGDYCKECGVGKVQKAPFRIKREPRWGRRHFTQLHWVFDEAFVRPEIWEEYLRPFGIECMPVIKHRTGEELKTVVQIDIGSIAESSIKTEGLVAHTCHSCKRVKYEPVTRGYSPGFRKPVEAPILKTQEYFGHGSAAYRNVIVSAQVYGIIKENRLKGLSFTPVA